MQGQVLFANIRYFLGIITIFVQKFVNTRNYSYESHHFEW